MDRGQAKLTIQRVFDTQAALFALRDVLDAADIADADIKKAEQVLGELNGQIASTRARLSAIEREKQEAEDFLVKFKVDVQARIDEFHQKAKVAQEALVAEEAKLTEFVIAADKQRRAKEDELSAIDTRLSAALAKKQELAQALNA